MPTEKMTPPKTTEKQSATEADFSSSSISDNQNITQLDFIYKILSNPTLTIVENFVKRTNPNPKKYLTTCMSEFSQNHSYIMNISLWIDI